MKSSRKELRRHAPMKRGRGPSFRATPLVRFTKKRRTTEWARIYGSKARVAWIKSLPCLACAALHPLFAVGSAGPSENCHTVTGGTGRKADAETIVPFCRAHHRRYDQHQAPFDTDVARDAVKADAARIAAEWRALEAAA